MELREMTYGVSRVYVTLDDSLLIWKSFREEYSLFLCITSNSGNSTSRTLTDCLEQVQQLWVDKRSKSRISGVSSGIMTLPYPFLPTVR